MTFVARDGGDSAISCSPASRSRCSSVGGGLNVARIDGGSPDHATFRALIDAVAASARCGVPPNAALSVRYIW